MFPRLKLITVFIILTLCFAATAVGQVFDHGAKRYEIDLLMESAINRGLISGGVVLIGNSRHDLLCRAYGKLSANAEARQVVTDTLFDIASLTKVVATAPAILKLVEDGTISLIDPVARWLPEFAGKGKDDLLIMHLLTHTSGLQDFEVSALNPQQSTIERAAARKSLKKPGSHFKYADINFILLAELLRRVTGTGLDYYAAEHIFVPLAMVDTGFNPPLESAVRCAASLDSDNSLLVGLVQDSNARLFGGVAGHAGLFSTASDLSRFCRMVLNHGILDGRRVLTSRTIELMTVPYFSHDNAVLRGLGWDIASPFSSPRGDGFSEVSFGHTGYSGGSLWIDPKAGIYVVLITARLDYKRIREFNKLRGNLSTIAASLYAHQYETKEFARKVE
jgi:CubicO group peptidase (beta-lactamase class C family)